MEYTLERFELDMRKVDLYVENAVAAFNITADEASLYSESTEYDLIMTEASDGLGAKIKAAFDKIIESIKKFFTNLIEKIKSIFTKDAETKVKKVIASNPELGKQSIEIVDIKSIQQYCGKRKILCANLVKKFNAGTLTQDEFDKTVQQMDDLKNKAKTVGKIAVPVIAALALIGGVAVVVNDFKKDGNETLGFVKKIKADYNKAMSVEIARMEADLSTNVAQETASAKTSIWKTILVNIKHPIKSAIDRKVVKNRDAAFNDYLNGGSVSPMSPASKLPMDDEDYNFDSADDLYDFDLTDTFFDI